MASMMRSCLIFVGLLLILGGRARGEGPMTAPPEEYGASRDVQKEPQSRCTAAEAALKDLLRKQAQERTPLWKRPWFWAIIGGSAVVAVGLGVGLGVGLQSERPAVVDFGKVNFVF